MSNNTETWNITAWIMFAIKMAYLHHSVYVRSCKRGSSGCTQNQVDATSSSSQPSLVSGPWGGRLAGISRLAFASASAWVVGRAHTGLPTPAYTWICTEMSGTQIPTCVPHAGRKPQLQLISVKVINIKTKIPEFRKQEWQISWQN